MTGDLYRVRSWTMRVHLAERDASSRPRALCGSGGPTTSLYPVADDTPITCKRCLARHTTLQHRGKDNAHAVAQDESE
jgi:hypothetical protein